MLDASTDLDRRIARLEDIEAIRRLKCEYAALLDAVVNDRADDQILLDLFEADATWMSEESGKYEGHREIRSFLKMLQSRVSICVTFMLNHRIEVSPDRKTAKGRWTTWAPLTLNGQPMLLACIYEDSYTRGEANRWKFSSVELRLKFVSNYKIGWVPQRISPDWSWKPDPHLQAPVTQE